ncbi:unnamed protein product [Caenorhabditis angaria]|uniref:Uncharacterized protein n=1 Tax=Caenorhabditis angaria TaxID=860376 RepID=A0A9P1ILW0_9PELO|nr:unnamed protein product [Caenorhabditis angaria]
MLFPTFASASESTSSSTPVMFATRLFGSPVSTSVIAEKPAEIQDKTKMPLDPMDSLWMSKPPQVSDLVVQPNVTFKAVTGTSPNSSQSSPIPIGGAQEGIRPDFDTDVLWKPPTRGNRQALKERTISMDSTDSEINGGRKLSSIEIGTSVPNSATSPMEIQPRTRRMSISEMLFGSSPNSFGWGMNSTNGNGGAPPASPNDLGDRKMSITEDPRFKDFMKHQSKILGDDGISGSGFKRSNYMKD